ncbi:hypothetical protein HYX16_02490 [Candidatus Woesearchaeota archaeon]|nr:hypothetical protein [Candidatus Woesearchaeota archaeon]
MRRTNRWEVLSEEYRIGVGLNLFLEVRGAFSWETSYSMQVVLRDGTILGYAEYQPATGKLITKYVDTGMTVDFLIYKGLIEKSNISKRTKKGLAELLTKIKRK